MILAENNEIPDQKNDLVSQNNQILKIARYSKSDLL